MRLMTAAFAPIASIALVVIAPGIARAADPITGQWVTENGNAVVTIAPCGKAMCGKITKILRPNPKGDGTDQRNPDPKLKSRPILGLTIIPSFTDAGRDWQGKIYSPEAGRDYKGYLIKQPDGTLQVKGCVAAFLCKNQKWSPAR